LVAVINYGSENLMIIPMLTCADAAAEMEFCRTAFGASVCSRRLWADGRVIHATLAIGSALFMVHGEIAHLQSRAPQLDGSSSVVIYLYVSDVDRTTEAAVASGAKVLLAPANQVWGDRVARIMDPAGHVWNIASHGGSGGQTGDGNLGSEAKRV
jgi:PhnB protein